MPIKVTAAQLPAFNTESLKNGMTAYNEHGIFIAGGSTNGLMVGAELLECLRSDRRGWTIGADSWVSSITGAVVYDLGVGLALLISLMGVKRIQTYHPTR